MGSLDSMMPWLAEVFGSEQVLRVLIAFLVLFAGWLIARIVAWGVRKGLEKTTIDCHSPISW